MIHLSNIATAQNPLGASWSTRLFPSPISQNSRWETSLDADSILIERCLEGDQGSWEDLVKLHTRRVFAICYRFVGKNEEAQDLTQDVFLRIFKSLGSFRAGEGSFTVWLTRLTRNLLIDHYRRTKGERMTDSLETQLPVIEETSLDRKSVV